MQHEITGFEHLHLHTDFSVLDGYGTTEEYAKRAPKINQKFLTISDHGSMGAIPRQIQCCDENGLEPIFACFFKGQEIITSKGVKNIESVVPGDLVLTHLGRFRKVIHTFSRKYSGECSEIILSDTQPNGRTIHVTNEHPFLVADNQLNRKWLPASKIVSGRRRAGGGIQNWKSYLCFPKTKSSTDTMVFSEVDCDFSNGYARREYSTRQPAEWRNIPVSMKPTAEIAWFLGLFVAEGSFSRKQGELTGGMRLSLNSGETDFADDAEQILLDCFGLTCGRHIRAEQNKMDVTFACLPLALFLESELGGSCYEKKVPQFIFQSTQEVKESFIRGLLDGDGKNPSGNGQSTLKVASKHLAWGLKVLLANMGIWGNVSEIQEGDKKSWQVPVSLDVGYRRSVEDAEYVYKPIREIRTYCVEDVDVYNFEVEEDNSYCTDVATHNCELYVNPMQPEVGKEWSKMSEFNAQLDEIQKKQIRKSYHLLAIAVNETGYSNLVNLSSLGWTKGFYYKPRVNHEMLMAHKEGLIFTSCCYNSEIGQAFDVGGEGPGFAMIEKYIEMFGKDNFYLEMMLLDFSKQKPYDEFIIKAHDRYGLPLIVTNDCFPAGTMVLTKDGYRPIESLSVGDEVFTAQRRWRKVEWVNTREVANNEQVYSVKCSLGSELFQATEEHPVWVAEWNPSKTRVVGHVWKKVSDLSDEDYIVFPMAEGCFADDPIKSIDVTEGLELSDVVRGHECRLDGDRILSSRGFNHQSKVEIPRFLPVDDEFLFVLGWYLAEGYCDKTSYQIGFGGHLEEKAILDRIKTYFSQFGIVFSYGNANCENGLKLIGSSKVFNTLFSRLCGVGATGKRFPLRKLLNRDQVVKVLAAYVGGDGCRQDNHTSTYTVSKQLVWDVVEIVSSMGIAKLPELRDNSAHGWSEGHSLNFGENARSVLWKDGNPTNHKRILGKFRKQGDYFYVKVSSCIPVEGVDKVYNLQVKEDETYIANAAAVHNCHYCQREDSHMQRLMLMVQTGTSIREIQQKLAQDEMTDMFELQDQNLWMKSESEINEKWESDYSDVIDYEIFKQAKANTVKICERAKGVKLDRSIKLPIIDEADEKLKEAVMEGFNRRHLPKTREYVERVKEEYNLICQKGFASYFLIQKMMTDEARRKCPELLGYGDGSEAVGPGRGSAVGALTCYCLGITDVDPIEHDLLFSRFLSPARGGKLRKFRFTIDPVNAHEVAQEVSFDVPVEFDRGAAERPIDIN